SAWAPPSSPAPERIVALRAAFAPSSSPLCRLPLQSRVSWQHAAPSALARLTDMRALRMLAALVSLVPLPAFAQSAPAWRTVDISRQLRDTQPQRVRVQYGAGRVD